MGIKTDLILKERVSSFWAYFKSTNSNTDSPLSAFSESDIATLVDALSYFVAKAGVDQLESAPLFLDLSYALLYGVMKKSTPIVTKVCSVIEQMAQKNPDILISMMNYELEFGELKGQHSTYIWLTQLHSATSTSTIPHHAATLSAIHLIFSTLQSARGDNLALSLAKTIPSGAEKGKNGLLVLALALLQLAKENNSPTALSIAKLISNCRNASANILDLVLIEEFKEGSHKGQSIICLLIGALKFFAINNADATEGICSTLIKINQRHPLKFQKVVSKAVELGPDKGLNVLQLLSTDLASACDVRHNSDSVNDISRLLIKLVSSDVADSALLTPACAGIYEYQNGVMFLVRAFIAAIEHQLDTMSLAELLIGLIQRDSKQLADAFITELPDTPHYNVSALLKLINKLPRNDEPSTILGQSTSDLKRIIAALASSESAHTMMLSLSLELQDIFVNEFSKEKQLPPPDVKRFVLAHRFFPKNMSILTGPTTNVNTSSNDDTLKV